MTDLRATLADLVADLVDPYVHAETIHLRSAIPDGRATQEIRIHRTRHPSLLDQLAAAVEPSSSATDGAGNTVPGSRPPLRIEAINHLAAIDTGVTRWLNRLNLEARDSLSANLRAVVGAPLSTDQISQIVSETRSWVAGTRIVVGWAKPAWRPNAPCPVAACNAPGSLRVNLEAKTAHCIRCENTWTDKDGSIQMLAEHVRWYRNDTTAKTAA